VHNHSRQRSAKLARRLRSSAGRWLRELREKRGLSQRELAKKVGVEFYTFISMIEHGRGRIHPDRYLVWAAALGVEPREFVRGLMSYYDPVTYNIIFGEVSARGAKRAPAQSSTIVKMRKRRPPARKPKPER
jgi:transcriptional regulator with XRE-family HTH domain